MKSIYKIIRLWKEKGPSQYGVIRMGAEWVSYSARTRELCQDWIDKRSNKQLRLAA